MDTKMTQTMKRLLKKLSAMRATLSDEEQELLDQIVLLPNEDVEAHRLDPRYDPRLDPKYDPRKDPAAEDVEAHKLDPRYDPRLDPKYDPRKDPAAEDVEAHKLDPRYVSRKDFRISWDGKKQTYTLIP